MTRSIPSLLQAQGLVTGIIDDLTRRWRELHRLTAIAKLASLSIGGLWLAMMLDNALMFSPVGLIACWLVWLGGASFLVYRLADSLGGRSPDDAALAHLYESRTNLSGNRLANAIAWARRPIAATDDPAELMKYAALIENASHLKAGTTADVLDKKPMRRWLVIAAGFLMALLIYAAARPAWSANAIARLACPWNPPAHLLATQFDITPGDVNLIEGQPLTIETKLSGYPASDVRVEYRLNQKEWTRCAMTQGDDGSWRYDGFKSVRQPMEYRLAAQYSVSPTHRVTLAYRPKIQSIQALVTWPDYAGKRSLAMKPGSGDVSALNASTVQIDVQCSQPLASAKLELSSGQRVIGQIVPGRSEQARFTFSMATGLTGYTLGLVGQNRLSAEPPPKYAISILPDQPPTALVIRPGRDLILPGDATLPLSCQAQDDVALAWVALQTKSPSDRDWQTLQTWNVPDATTRSFAFSASLDLTRYKLEPKQILSYRLIAADRRPPSPNLFHGRAWNITAISPAGNQSLLAPQIRQLLDLLNQALVLQKENRQSLEMDRPIESIVQKQQAIPPIIRQARTFHARTLSPKEKILRELDRLLQSPLTDLTQKLPAYRGEYKNRWQLKAPLLADMDLVITSLQQLIDELSESLKQAEQAQDAIEKQSPAERQQSMENLRALMQKLKQFAGEQDKAIADTQELARQAADFTQGQQQQLEKIKGIEDRWAKILAGGVQDITKLTEQGFADATVANDYKEMVEQIEAAVKDLNPKTIVMAVKREETALELSQTIVENMEMWLPSTPDNVKWVMEEPLEKADVPMPPLPDQLMDMIGELMAEEEQLTEDAEDITSAWADSISAAGWLASDGPISNFSARGITGNQLPNNHEVSGRSGEGRSGRSQGQLVQDTVRGLGGRQTPSRVTNDPYEKGVVKELQQQAVGGSTGGGKMRGAGQEGLQGTAPPPIPPEKMQAMRDWQQRLRQDAEKIAQQLRSVHLQSPDLDKALELMKQREQQTADGKYASMLKTQRMLLQQLRLTSESPMRDSALRADPATTTIPEPKKQMLQATDESASPAYQDAIGRYFEQMSSPPPPPHPLPSLPSLPSLTALFPPSCIHPHFPLSHPTHDDTMNRRFPGISINGANWPLTAPIGWIMVGLIWFYSTASAQTPTAWWNNDWAYRATVQCPAGDGDVALVTLNLAGRTETDGRDIRLVSESGQLLPFDLLHHDPDWNTQLRCQVTPGQAQTVHVYYGNPKSLKPEPMPWQAKRGLIAWFYRKPPGEKEYHPGTLAELKSLIQRSTLEGALLVPAISEGFNPVGESDGYVSVYEGYARIDQPGNYRFCTASDDGSWVVVNGQPVIAWPGAHGWTGAEKGQVNGEIYLSPGTAKVEYYHEEGVGTQMAFLGVKTPPPQGKHYTAIPNDRWLSVRQGQVTKYEARQAAIMAVPDVQMVNTYWLSDDGPMQATLLQHVSRSFCRSGTIITTRWEFDDGLSASGTDVSHVYFRFGRPAIRLSVIDEQGRQDRITCKPSLFPVDVQSTWFRYGTPKQYAAIVQKYDLQRMTPDGLIPLALFWSKTEDWSRHVQTVLALAKISPAASSPQYGPLLVSAAQACLENQVYAPEQSVKFAQLAEPYLTDPAANAQNKLRLAQTLALHRDQPQEAEGIALSILDQLKSHQPAVAETHSLWRQAYAVLGDIALMQDNFDQAKTHYAKAEQLATASMSKSQRLAQLGGAPYTVEDLLSRDQFDWANQTIDEWESRFPTQKLDGLTFFWRGKVLYVQKPGEAALRWLTLAEKFALPTSPHLPETRWLKANTLLAMKRFDQAKAAFEQLIQMEVRSELAEKAKQKIRECPVDTAPPKSNPKDSKP